MAYIVHKYILITFIFTVESGINSNALNGIWLYIMLFSAILYIVLLISNATVNCAVTYTKKLSSIEVNHASCTTVTSLN